MGYPARRQKGNFSEALSRFSARFPSSVAGHRNVLRAPCGATDKPTAALACPPSRRRSPEGGASGANGPARPQVHQNVTHFAHFAAKYPVLRPKLKTFLENALQIQELYDIIMKITLFPVSAEIGRSHARRGAWRPADGGARLRGAGAAAKTAFAPRQREKDGETECQNK